MGKRLDIKKILVIGAGPIVIGQACEFDYSGTQACKALKEEGYKIILINSNPATIMTDPDVADKTYIEPITLEVLEKIIIKEKPSAILPTVGGQTALNLAIEAEKKGILKKYKIELIGANSKAISNAEDRSKFRRSMMEINLDLPKSVIINNFKNCKKALREADLVILAGVPCDFRLDYGRNIHHNAKIISINFNRGDMYLNRRPSIGILTNPGSVLRC